MRRNAEAWKQRARALKRELYALSIALRDRRTPWYAKALGIVVVAYALSPIDLIPDPIPVLGHLDDLILLPLGIALVLKMIPATVMEDSRSRAQAMAPLSSPAGRVAAAVIVGIWIALLVLAVLGLRRMLTR